MITPEVNKQLEENQVLLLVIPNEHYSSDILEITGNLSQTSKSICYVSLNRLYQPLIRKMQENNIDVRKFFIIDGITKTAIPNPPKTERCEYIPAPNALTDLNLAIAKTSCDFNIDTLIFDSLSTILIYERDDTITKFIHFLIIKLRSLDIKCVFTCLKGDTDTGVIKALSMFVDVVLRLE